MSKSTCCADDAGDEVGVRRPDAGLGEGDADIVVVVVRVERAAEPVDAGVEAQPLAAAEQVAVLPVGGDADAVDRRERAADAHRARPAVLDHHGDRQAAVRPDLVRLDEAHGVEHPEPVQPVLPGRDVVGIEGLALRQVGHEGDERGVGPPAAADHGLRRSRASCPGSRVSVTSRLLVAWSAITSRSASRALARESWRQRSIDSAEAWLITADRAAAPGVKPADSGVSTWSRSFDPRRRRVDDVGFAEPEARAGGHRQ